MMAESWWQPHRNNFAKKVGLWKHQYLYNALLVAQNFAFIYCSFILFRSESVAGAWHMMSHLSFWGAKVNFLADGIHFHALHAVVVAVGIVFMLWLEYKNRQVHLSPFQAIDNMVVRWGTYYLVIFSVLIFSRLNHYDAAVPFYYFQF